MILGVVYIGAGFYVMSHPFAGLLTLAFLLGLMLLVYGWLR